MSHRAWWLVISAIVLLCIAVAVQDGMRRAEQKALHDGVTTADDARPAMPATDTAASALDAETVRARNEAMTEAVAALHAYVAALFKTDRSEADAAWTGGRPATHGEADLRALEGVTGVRVDNGRPEPLDTAPVPTQLRIPVRLRVGVQGPLKRYEGHYDLRREADGWRITGASVDPLAPARNP